MGFVYLFISPIMVNICDKYIKGNHIFVVKEEFRPLGTYRLFTLVDNASAEEVTRTSIQIATDFDIVI